MKILIFLLGAILCLLVYPSSFFYPKDTLPDDNDTRLISYIIGQVQNNILEKKSLYHATFFAPEPNTLTYSDLFLTTGLLTLPARIFTDNPVLIFNIGFVLNFTLTFFASFLFFQKISKGLLGSITASLLFNLSSIHLHYYAHLQVFSFWIFFAALYSLISFLESHKQKYLHLFLIFTSFQLAETIFATYLLFFASVFFYLYWHKRNNTSNNRAQADPASYREVGSEHGFGWVVSFLPYVAVWIYLLIPYAKTHFLYQEATRSIRDAAHFSLGLEEIFTKYQSWATLTIIILFTHEELLAFFVAIFCKVRRAWSPAKTGVYALQTRRILLFSLIMSLGPVLKIFGHTIKPLQSIGLDWPIPLPYALFYYFFPGFTGFRTPSRFILLALFGACTIIAIYVNKHFERLKAKTKALAILLILTLLTLENYLPLTGYPANINPPTVYEQVAKLPRDSIILELPIKLWNMSDHQIESIRSLYSLEHKHKRLNGYSGFATLDWIKLVEEINTYGLTEKVVQKLKTRGVTHVVQNNELSEI